VRFQVLTAASTVMGHVFIFEHYFASKSFAADSEAISSANPDKVQNKTTVHRLVTKFRVDACV
jgi:hypothetical protein